MDEAAFVADSAKLAEQTSQPTSVVGSNATPNLGTILSIPVTVQVILGSTSLPVASLIKLARGAVISLDQRVGDPVDIVVNGKVVARGEIVVVDESTQRFGVSLVEIVATSGVDHAA